MIRYCADDFGAFPWIDEAILRLNKEKKIQATSCLAIPGSGALANLSSIGSIQLGLHLYFTEFPRHTNKNTKGSSAAPFFSSFEMAYVKSLGRMVDQDKIYEEMKAQWLFFERSVERSPDFVDGHQHIHQLPGIRESMIRLVKEMGNRAWIRSSYVSPLWKYRYISRGISGIVGLSWIGLHGHALREQLKKNEIRTNDILIGYHGYKNRKDFSKLRKMTNEFSNVEKEDVWFFFHPSLPPTETVIDSIVEARIWNYSDF
jgi:hypothetical protein